MSAAPATSIVDRLVPFGMSGDRGQAGSKP